MKNVLNVSFRKTNQRNDESPQNSEDSIYQKSENKFSLDGTVTWPNHYSKKYEDFSKKQELNFHLSQIPHILSSVHLNQKH